VPGEDLRIHQRAALCILGPRNATSSLASLSWKYWRYRLPTRVHLVPVMKSIMMNVREAGDGWLDRNKPETTQKLEDYLMLSRCTGQLDPKPFSASTKLPSGRDPAMKFSRF
jgi:hypothetical protein